MGKRINYVTRDMLSRLSKRLFRRCQLLEKWMLSWKKRAEELETDLNKYDELGCAMSKRFMDVYKNNLELWKLNQKDNSSSDDNLEVAGPFYYDF